MNISNFSGLVPATLLCLAMTACSAPATEEETPEAQTAANPADTDGGATGAQVAPPPAASASTPEYTFELLTRSAAPVKDPRIVATQDDHPCGPLDSVRVSAIPMNDPVFKPSYVVEFDAQGKETTKWGIPVEATVVDLQGQRLQFDTKDGRFWVTTEGELEKVESTGNATDLRTKKGMFDCPSLPTYAGAGAEQCFNVKDAEGKDRRIAIEGTCS